MKYFPLLFIIIFLLSCGSNKKAITTKIETPIAPILPKPPKPQIVEYNKDKIEVENKTEEKIVNITDSIIEHETTFEYFNHLIWKELLNKNVNANGNGKVDYKGFKNEVKKLRSYINSLTVYMPTNEWSKEDKLAYWINAYNALTIDLIIRKYPLKSIKDIDKPWDQHLWKFGDKWLSLNTIEHKILRKMDEPRIHFAIVCASKSCPKLRNKPFYATSIDEDLTSATKEFLSDTSKNELSKNKIKLSKIFKWFAKDFKENTSLIDFLNQYSEVTISEKTKKKFKDYNWGLND